MENYSINFKDVYRYLGYGNNEPDEVTKLQVLESAKELEAIIKPKSIYKILPVEIDNADGVSVSGTILKFPGKNIKQLLSESSKCVLMAVTLGAEFDRLIKQVQIRDMAKAVVLDACGNSLVEEYCNFIEDNLYNELKSKDENTFFTDRFSPGYGDLPLDIQPTFCKVLECDKKIGVNVSATNLMSPKKSITAVIGISNTPQPMRIKGCSYCMLVKDCEYRKGGVTCGS